MPPCPGDPGSLEGARGEDENVFRAQRIGIRGEEFQEEPCRDPPSPEVQLVPALRYLPFSDLPA